MNKLITEIAEKYALPLRKDACGYAGVNDLQVINEISHEIIQKALHEYHDRLVEEALSVNSASVNLLENGSRGKEMNKNQRIQESKCQLADVLREVADDLESGSNEEWQSITDMLNATLNNVRHDFAQERPSMRKRVWR